MKKSAPPVEPIEIHAETMRLSVWAANLILEAMDEAKITRSDLAARLGIPRSRVTRVLDGGENITLETFAKFGLACGVRWQLERLK